MDWRLNDTVIIPVQNSFVYGELEIPLHAQSVVIFSHGSGSSRLSPRNQFVARYLHQQNIGTLLFDLLTEKEDLNYQNRFDITLLTKRLIRATEWLVEQPVARQLSLGYFGASTGAASAIRAASLIPNIQAVVSRGGRPDLAGTAYLIKLEAPSLLIVGSLDTEVIRLNEWAAAQIKGENKLEIVPGATHLFEEAGTMDKVCELAAAWFRHYLIPVEA